VLADSVTVLSENYRFGFRNEGDFDLRNNAAGAVIPWWDVDNDGSLDLLSEIATLKSARLSNGFFTNNFVTNGLSSGTFNADGSGLIPPDTLPTVPRLGDSNYASAPPNTINADEVRDSSYFNNFATPVQRRGNFPQYLMEVCVKLPVAACGPNDWFINPGTSIKASTVIGAPYVRATSLTDASNFKAGTTVDPPVPELQRFPRRVAFERSTVAATLDDLPAVPTQPLGIDGSNTTVSATVATPVPNSLWFGMKNSAGNLNYDTAASAYLVNTNGTDGNGLPLPPVVADSKVQPLLLPVLQIQTVVDADGVRTQSPPAGTGTTSIARNSRWMPPAVTTSQNMIVGTGDTPSRQLTSTSGDFNGGLQNLPRFLENWNKTVPATSTIKGSFIQLNRSAYNTAPYLPILNAVPPNVPTPVAPNPPDPQIKSLFFATGLPTPENRYRTDNGGGRIPSFTPPGRNWGYDVGILSQSPDLFTQRFTAPPTATQPAEYFREVPRNDEWVTTLLCGKTAISNVKAVSDTYRSPNCPN
jgi:hypothetical protein